jgi:hypothetical protein
MALSACAADITMAAAWSFIADITIAAWLFAVAVGEGGTGTGATISRRAHHDRATEAGLTCYGARLRHCP